MPACAFAHHSTAANAAARRAARSALANAPCTSLLRRDAAAPLPLPCPALDWTGLARAGDCARSGVRNALRRGAKP